MALAAALFSACGAYAAEEGQPVRAVRAGRPINLDGRLDEADWASAPLLDRFVEYYPGDRSAPSEHTSARFLYDDRYIYIGLRADLRDPSRLRTPFVRRDKVGASHDYMQVYIDPLGARRSAYIFRVNARGVKTDGLQNEAGQSETTDPDYDWDVATHIDAHGWSAELRIPLTTLRISRVGDQRWWVIVTRGVPRENNTQMATARFPHFSSCFLCYASALTFSDLTPKTDNLIVTPSATASGTRNSGAMGSGDHIKTRPSLDAKWLPYPGGAVDLTIKPDFSQVEADSPQLTANARFAINLPEKRPFFREGLDLVQTPIAALYTRTVAEPDVGLRFTNRSDNLNATVFAARDVGRPGIIEPGLLSSSIGYPTAASDVVFVHAKLAFGGSTDGGVLGAIKRNEDGSYNAVSGFDGVWGDVNNHVTGQILASQTQDPNRPDLLASWRGQTVSGLATLLDWYHTGPNVWTLHYERYDDGFQSWLGYVPRVDYQQVNFDLRHQIQSGIFGLNDLEPYVDGLLLTPLNHHGYEGGPAFGFTGSGRHNLNFDVSLHPEAAVLNEQGDVRETTYAAWTFFVNPHPRVPLLQVNGTVGQAVDFATGEVTSGQMVAITLDTRPIDRLDLTFKLSGDQLGDNPKGGERLRETALELSGVWFFGPAFYLLADYQLYKTDRRYPVVDRDTSSLASLQFSWTPRRDLQAFWGIRSGADQPIDPANRGRSTEIYVKLARTFGVRFKS